MSIKVDNLAGFNAAINSFKIEIRDEAESMARRVAFAVDRQVVLMSPVDTGRFRANWQVSLNVDAAGTVEHIPGVKGSTRGPNTQKALDQLDKLTKQFKLGDTIVIINNVDYGVYLNDGTSKQAPRNFVQIAAMAGIAAAKR
jgi:hypothetical protein